MIAKLHLPRDYTMDEAAQRGYMSHVFIELGPDQLYPVFFYTHDRLHGDLGRSATFDQPFIAETGMVVLAEMTLANIEAAVAWMVDESYFDYMMPLSRERIAAANPLHWPP